MRVIIFGASGTIGALLTSRALQAGHTVTAFVRSPGKITVKDKNLTLFQGDVSVGQKVTVAIRGNDVVLVALGTRKVINPGVDISAGTHNIVEAMKATGVKRFIVLSAFGVRDSYKASSPLPKLTYKAFLKRVFADKARQEQYVEQSDLDWTIVRPTTFSNKPGKGEYQIDVVPRGIFPTIPREDVVDFMIKNIEDRSYIGKIVAITS